MSKFLMRVSLTQDGAKGLAKDGGTKRKHGAEQFFKSVGGKLEAFILPSVTPTFLPLSICLAT